VVLGKILEKIAGQSHTKPGWEQSRFCLAIGQGEQVIGNKNLLGLFRDDRVKPALRKVKFVFMAYGFGRPARR
jgi:hypothetical protein